MPAFTDKDWKDALANLAAVIGPDAAKYETVATAKLVAAIPYLADSEDPDRFALSNLLTFHAAIKARAVFNHRPSDDADLRRRLATFHIGSQANRKVVNYGLTLLSLISLSDHEHDLEGDKKAGKYNPIASGKWDAKALRKQLQAELDSDAALKAQFEGVVPEISAQSFWNT